MLFEEAYKEFLIYASKLHKKQYLDTMSQNINKHVLPYFKDKMLIDINFQLINQWYDYILSLNFSNNYNKNIYSCFNGFLNYCLMNSYIDENYLSLIGCFKKKYEQHDYNTYSLREFKRFRKFIDNKIYRYFYDLLFFTGVRSGEAMALKFSDISSNSITINKTLERRGNRNITLPKTKNSIMNIKISYSLSFKIMILKCIYLNKYCECSDDYFVFGGKSPLSPTSINRHKHKACVKGNIKEITNHEFRHSYATRMINKGIPIDVISKNLGHSSISITLDVYVHKKKRCESPHLNTISQNINKVLQSIITYFICNNHNGAGNRT